MWYAILVIGAILSLAIIWSIVQKNSFSKSIDVLQPWYPIVGNLLMIIGKDDLQKFQLLSQAFNSGAKLFRYYIGPKPLFCTGDPDTAKQILTDINCMDKPYFYDFLMIDKGVIAAKSHIWKGQRKALFPAFNTKVLASFLPIFTNGSKNMIRKLESMAVTGETFNIIDYATTCALETVCETTMGFDSTVFTKTDELGSKIQRVLSIAARRMLKFHHHLDCIYRWSEDYREERTVREYLTAHAMQVYEDAHDRYSKGLMNNTTDVDENQCFRKPQIFVNQLFTSTIRKFEREEIIDNIQTMVAAGTDSSANIIAFTLLQLAMDAHYQQKVYEEIMQVFPEKEPNITMERLSELKLTEMVLNETLRLYPVVPIVMRENSAEMTLCGQQLPKGCMFAINIFTIQRRKDLWGPDADSFNPERFSPERSAGRHPFAFLAFSGGSRNCLGIRYAMISMKVMMVYLMKSFRFKTNIREEDIRFRFDVLLRIEGGHMMQIEKRYVRHNKVPTCRLAYKMINFALNTQNIGSATANQRSVVKMWCEILFIGAILSLAIIWSIVQKNRFSKNIEVVQPWYPLVGNLLMFIGKDDLQKFEIIHREFNREAKLFRGYMGPIPIFCTGDPDMAQQILTDCIDKPYPYDFMKVKNGVFASKTHIWKGQRKALSPAFNTSIIASFLSIFTNRSMNMIKRLESMAVTGETFNILDYATTCTLEMVCETTLGFDSSVFNRIDELGAKIHSVFSIAARRIMKVHHHFDFIYHWCDDCREMRTVQEYLTAHTMQVYEDAHDRYSKGLMNDVDENQCFRKPQIFVNQLFTSTIRKFEREEIIDNILTMIGAGSDTSANVIAFALLQLAMDAHYQQKVYEEIMQVFPEKEPNITMERLSELKLTEMVLNETLRLYPVAPILMRQNMAEMTVCGQQLPKDCIFIVNIFTIHRRKDLWGPDADCFNPERFSPERSAGRHPFAFLGFSGGPRNCLGIRYAMISMKIMIVFLMKSFRFKTNIREEDIRFKLDAMLRIEGGHMIQIEKRL
ncbi:uncharacterized protein LOC134222964 [Armigeres subalbatus]|uniref:uncharacterized protein LOC134222964 n=1 Tax=Armigeres subalbatus TaxID=124917 RepID=UPI002ED512D4